MSKAKVNENLVKVKLALAEKCDRLVKTSKSIPKKKTLQQQAAKFRAASGRPQAQIA